MGVGTTDFNKTMQGISERQYAAHVGLSRGAIQKAKAAGQLVLHDDGSIDAAASDRLRAEATDPSKTRKAPPGRRPDASLSRELLWLCPRDRTVDIRIRRPDVSVTLGDAARAP